MSPAFRRACHQALDIVLDAWVDEQAEEPKKRRRGSIAPPPKPSRPLTPDEQEQLDRQMARAGFRKTG